MIRDLNRREFLMYSLMTAGMAGMAVTPGCGISKKNVPDFKGNLPFLLTGGRVVDVNTGQITDNAYVLCDGNGRIAAMGPGLPESSHGCRVLNLNGRYLVPGLIDAHCHSSMSPVFAMRTLDLLRHSNQVKMNYVSSIESGVTTLRDMGAMAGILHMMRNHIKRGGMPGPRVVYCNSILNIKGGHPEINPTDINLFAKPMSVFTGMVMSNFTDMEDMNDCLEKNVRGASFIKLTLDDKTLFCKKDPSLPVYTREELDAVFRFADAKGLPVSGHHHYKFGFDRAMAYPFHSLEHVVADQILSDEDIQAMADRKTAIVPTLTIAQSYLMEEAYDTLPDDYRTERAVRELAERKRYFETEASRHCHPALHAFNLSMLRYYKTYPLSELFDRKKFLVNPDLYGQMINNGCANVIKMKEAGILIGCGIDAGMPLNYFGGLYREFEIFHRLGFSPLDILRCATINNAKILNRESDIGSLEPGKYADMVAYDANPLEDVRVLRSPALVFKEGEMMFSSRNPTTDGTVPA